MANDEPRFVGDELFQKLLPETKGKESSMRNVEGITTDKETVLLELLKAHHVFLVEGNIIYQDQEVTVEDLTAKSAGFDPIIPDTLRDDVIAVIGVRVMELEDCWSDATGHFRIDVERPGIDFHLEGSKFIDFEEDLREPFGPVNHVTEKRQ